MENKIDTVEPAYLPGQKLNFLIDWLVTLKCNFNCAYCGLTGHDNRRPHPPVEKCIETLEQMYQYVDTINEYKKIKNRDVILNIYGGESLYHPDIEKILEMSSQTYNKYSSKWKLTRRMTTNASAMMKKWKVICEHIEGFTLSYHPSYHNEGKHKQRFLDSVEYLQKINKPYDMIIMFDPRPGHWETALKFYDYCKDNNFNSRPKLVDGSLGVYSKEQYKIIKILMNTKDDTLVEGRMDTQGRACCGGRKMCINRDLKNPQVFVPRTVGFKGWHCSAPMFFLFGNSDSGEYYTTKDCHVSLNGRLEPCATVDTTPDYIKRIKLILQRGEQPILKCVQQKCICGTCAPKSKSFETLQKIMNIYATSPT